MKITFKQQAEKFLIEGATRKRHPLSAATLRAYRSDINANLNPLIGDKTLQAIDGKVVKSVIAELAAQGLRPRTIQRIFNVLKGVRESVVSDNGEIVFKCDWSADFLDLPAIDDAKQPTVSAQAVQDAISKADMTRKALYTILASTGLRIAEALALKVGTDDGVSTIWIPSESKIIVRQQKTRVGLAVTKTKAGVREIDLDPKVNEFLSQVFAGSPVGYELFSGSPDYLREVLATHGIEGGFHAFRRFRITHLKLQGVPDALIKFWVGHEAGDITEVYTQVGGEIQSRKEWAAKAGLGFQLPEIV